MACRKDAEPPAPDDIDGWRILFEDARDYAFEQLDQAVEEGNITASEGTDLEGLYPDIFENGDTQDQV
jgi:hypothetical protein